MVKTKQNKSLATKLILWLSLAVVVFMLATPIIFFNYGTDFSTVGIKALWGAPVILGIGGKNIMDGTTVFRSMTFNFNWYLYINLLAVIVLGVTTYIIGPRKRGYYIFAALAFVVAAVVIYTTKIWTVNASVHLTNGTTGDYARAHLGVGPWAAGLFCCINVIACLFEFKTSKYR